jgi:hypothetical protein
MSGSPHLYARRPTVARCSSATAAFVEWNVSAEFANGYGSGVLLFEL